MKKHFCTAYSFILLSFSLIIVGAHQVAAQTAQDQQVLQTVVTKFFTDCTHKDINGAMSLWSSQSPDFRSEPNTLLEDSPFKFVNDARVRSLRIVTIVPDGKTLWARVLIHIIGTDTLTQLPDSGLNLLNDVVFQFVQEQGQWKIRRFGTAVEITGPLMSNWRRPPGLPEDASLGTSSADEIVATGRNNPLFLKLSKPLPGEKIAPASIALSPYPAEPPLLTRPLTPQDQVQIKDVVQQFFRVYAGKDLEGCMTFYADDSWEYASRMAAFEKIFNETGPIQVASLSTSLPSAINGYGVVRIHVNIQANDLKSHNPYALFGVLDRAMQLVRTPQGWRIWRYGTVEQEVAYELVAAKTPQIRQRLIAMQDKHFSLSELVSFLNTLFIVTLHRDASNFLPSTTPSSLETLATRNATVVEKPHPEVIRISDIAIETATRVNNLSLLAQCYRFRSEAASEMGLAQEDLLGQYHVIIYAQKALSLATKANDTPEIVRDLIVLAKNGNPQGSASIWEKLLSILRQMPNTKLDNAILDNAITRARVGAELGRIYQAQQRYSEALPLFEARLMASQQENDAVTESSARIAIGDCDLGLNNPSAALEQYTDALQGSNSSDTHSNVYLWLRQAEALRLLGRNPEAEATYRKVLPVLRRGEWELAEDCEIGLGDISYSQNKWEDAASAYGVAINYSENADNDASLVDLEEDRQDRQLFWNTLTHREETPYVLRSQALLKLPNAAPEDLFAASEQAKARQLLNLIQNRKPDIRSELTESERNTEAILDNQVTRLTLGIDRLQSVPKPDLLQVEVVQQQRVAAQRDLKSYLHSVERAVHEANRQNAARPLDSTENAKVSVLEDRIARIDDKKTSLQFQDINNTFPTASPIDKQKTDAYEVRRQSIATQITRLDAQLALLNGELDKYRYRNRLMTPEQKQKEDQLKENYSASSLKVYEVQSATPNNASEIASAQSIRSAAGDAYQNYEDQLSEANPKLRSTRERFLPVSLTNVNAKLLQENPNLCILSYLVGKSTTLLLVLTRDVDPAKPAHLNTYRLAISSANLNDEVDRFRTACASPDTSSDVINTQARHLYDLLIAPAGNQIASKTHLIFVPDGVLNIMPFQAIADPEGHFLLERFIISYAPSVTALIKMRELSRQNRNNRILPMLAVGRPAFDGELPDLPATEPEARNIARLFHTIPLLGAQATRAHVLGSIENSQYVHFATHGLPDQIDPMYSALALAHTNAASDRLLARDLLDLDLHADLVVLSACQTALGRRVAGEGVLGLTWALFIAGTPSTVSTLWSIPDASTSTLMLNFYENMHKQSEISIFSSSKAEALREAQLRLIHTSKYYEPYYWAPFVLSGNW